MIRIQDLAAKLNSQAIDGFIRNVRAMPGDKQTWQPETTCRSALNQAQECAVITGFTVHSLKTLELPPMDNESFGKAMAELDTVDKAVAALEKNKAELNAAILNFPDADLEKTIKLPWEETPSPMAEIMFLNYWNLVYHQGQLCYIQTMYGDNEMH